MSSTSINSNLSQAYALIEADQHNDAVELLRPLLAEHPNNADAWWLYAHAVTDIDDAHAALQTVLALDPQYPEAQHLMEQLEEASRGAGNPLVDMELQPIRAIPDLPDALPELEPMSDVEREMAYGDVTERPRRGLPDWLRVVGLALIFLAAIVGALLLSQSALAPGNETTTAPDDAELTATSLIAGATGTAAAAMGQGGGDLSLTATAIVAAAQGQMPTQEIDLTARANALVPLQSAFRAEFGATADVTLGSTNRGETLIVRLCSQEPGVLLRATLERALEVLAGQGNLVQFGTQAIGIRLVSCDAPDTEYRLLTATMNDLQGYMSGIFDAEAFQARLVAE